MRSPLLLAVVAVVAAALVPTTAAAATVPGQYIVVLNDGADRGSVVSDAKSRGGTVGTQYRHALNGFAARLPAAAVAALEANPAVRFVSPDEPMTAGAQAVPEGIDRIDADRSSTRAGDGRGSVNVNVAVLDSGIDVDHPDLNVVGGVDCTRSGRGFDDDNGHGTHVAGTIGARDDAAGVVGVAPGARLFAVKVSMKNNVAPSSALICGIDWVTGTRVDADPTNDVQVANMSIGGKGSDDGSCGRVNRDAMHLAFCNSTARGVTYVVSAMNDGRDFQNVVPAAYDEVLTASAMADYDGVPGAHGIPPAGTAREGCLAGLGGLAAYPDDHFAAFSNFATLAGDAAHTVSAPGVCVLSTFLAGGYAVETGTSMASPHVAGTVALCVGSGRCAGPSPAQVIQTVRSDAAAYNAATPAYGFDGDPLRPFPGRYFGYLVRAGLY